MKTRYKMVVTFMIFVDVLIKLIFKYVMPEMIGKKVSILGGAIELYPTYNYAKANFRIPYSIFLVPFIIIVMIMIKYIKYLIRNEKLRAYSLFCIYLVFGSLVERFCIYACKSDVLDYIGILKYKIFDLTDFYLIYSGMTLIVMLIKLSYKDKRNGCNSEKEFFNYMKTEFYISKNRVKNKEK